MHLNGGWKGDLTLAEQEEILAVATLTGGQRRIAAGHFLTSDRILSDWRAAR